TARAPGRRGGGGGGGGFSPAVGKQQKHQVSVFPPGDPGRARAHRLLRSFLGRPHARGGGAAGLARPSAGGRVTATAWPSHRDRPGFSRGCEKYGAESAGAQDRTSQRGAAAGLAPNMAMALTRWATSDLRSIRPRDAHLPGSAGFSTPPPPSAQSLNAPRL